MNKILVVDDDVEIQKLLTKILTASGYQPVIIGEGKKVLEQISKISPDLVLLDLKLPGIDGLKILEEIKKINPNLVVIIITAYGDVPSAVKAMKLGAYDFIDKPFTQDELVGLIKKALQTKNLYREMESLKKKFYHPDTEEIIAESPAIKKILEKINIVTPTNMTVIIEGESGTGKELLAHLIHQRSLRKAKPFVAIDCGAIPETLVESELFGYEKGAFTGADSQKIGQFEKADEGTLFLDEIANFSDAVQMKFLRVLEEKKLLRLGGQEYIGFDVRIIVASNVSLIEAVHEGKFREDLFHRLNEFLIMVPALRERREEIPFLANHFLQEANLEFDKKIENISTEAMKFLESYPWPGNIRQLKNVVRKVVLVAGSGSTEIKEISAELLESQAEVQEMLLVKQGSLKAASAGLELQMIKEALEKTGGNKAEAARILNISRKTLYRKMRELNLGQSDPQV